MIRERSDETGTPTERREHHPVVISPSADFLLVALAVSAVALAGAALLV